jgi:transposase
MANHLEMALIHSIITLKGQGWSNRRIARELGVDRETVRRHLLAANAANAAANPPHGSAALESGIAAPNTATNPPHGSPVDSAAPASESGAGPASSCEPFRARIEAMLAEGLSGRRICQDLAGEPDSPSYDAIKRFLRRLPQGTPLPFRRVETPPGQESQVDFGCGAPILGAEGKRRRTHVFRIVLSHSRKAYSEAVYRQTTDDFIACLENAFHAFGGVTRTLVIDNLKAAVRQPDWFDPQLNPRLEAFCRHYGTVILPTKPYTPRHKGKVERGIAYVQDNGLKGHSFADLAQQNAHLQAWEKAVADTRIHGTIRRQVGLLFEQVERGALLPLPAERFPFFHEQLRMVQRDGHVAVARAYYSAPPEYLGRRVWVRWDAHLVRIFNTRMEQVAVHARQEPGRFATAPAHLADRKISAVERGTEALLRQAAVLGPQVSQWAREMLQSRGIAGVRVLTGLLSLARRRPEADLTRACQIASSHRAYHLRAVRELLDAGGTAGEQASFEFLDAHPIIRELHEYDALVHAAIHRSAEEEVA